MRYRTVATILIAFMAAPLTLGAQNVSVDENGFRLYVDGQAAGNEQFSIRQIGPAGQKRLVLRGTVELDLPDGAVSLNPTMDARGDAIRVFEYEVAVSGTETANVRVTVDDNRFLTRILSPRGEQLREFRAGPGSVLLDAGVVHHHHLLLPFLDEASSVSLTVLSPRTARQDRMTLSFVGEEEIRVGGVLVSGVRRFHLEGGDLSRDVWFDGQGRILRLEIPAQSLIAERESFS